MNRILSLDYESRGEQLARERDAVCRALYEMDLAIRSYVANEVGDDPYRSDLWMTLQREIGACQQRLRDVVIHNNEFYATMSRCERDLADRAGFFESHCHPTRHDIAFLLSIFDDCSVTQKACRRILDIMDGGHMVWPTTMDAYDEFVQRELLHTRISVTVPKRVAIQTAMRKYGGIGASLLGNEWKVYFAADDEEKAMLFKCAA